jgi:hypothetical protein
MQTLPVVSRAIDSVRDLGIGAIITITLIVLGVLLFNGVFFYAEPGFQYLVRTITGSEKVVNDTGFNTKLFGRVTEWKKALTVRPVLDLDDGGGDESVIATISAFSEVFSATSMRASSRPRAFACRPMPRPSSISRASTARPRTSSRRRWCRR